MGVLKNHPALSYVMKGQFVFFGSLVICCLLAFNSTLEDKGVSYFGIHYRTVVPYLIGFLGTAWYCRKAALALPDVGHKRWIKRCLNVMAAGLVGVAITPYSIAGWIFAVHVFFATAVFLAEIFMTLWLTFWVVSSALHTLLFGLQSAAAIVSALSLEFVHVLDFMFIGQVICQAAFVVLLTLELNKVLRRRHVADTADAGIEDSSIIPED